MVGLETPWETPRGERRCGWGRMSGLLAATVQVIDDSMDGWMDGSHTERFTIFCNKSGDSRLGLECHAAMHLTYTEMLLCVE